MLLGLTIGNSRLRYGLLDGVRVLRSEAVEWSAFEGHVTEILDVAARLGAARAVAGSVRDDLLGIVERSLPARFLPLQLARRDFPLPIENLYERPEEVGTDRLLGAIAARARARGAGAVVVDFGTAVTVGIVSPGGAFLGGPIAAGTLAIARGLCASAPKLADSLPKPCDFASESARGPSPSPELPARSTAAALRAGIYWEVAGGVRALLLGVLRSAPVRPRVYATGGEAELFSREIPEIDEVVPDLVLEGLALAWAARPEGLGAGRESPP